MDIVACIALAGTALGACSYLPAIVAVVRGRPAKVPTSSLGLSMASSLCILVYASANRLWPVMVHSSVGLLMNGTVIAWNARAGQVKRSASGTDLALMDPTDAAT